MIYCDTPYLARAYLHEAGYEDVRRLMQTEDNVGSCLLGQVELVSVFHRNLREKRITPEEHERFLSLFEEDCRNNVWTWFPFDAGLVGIVAEVYRRLPASIFLRAADALHLACAKENGFKKIYTHDKQMITAAPHFGIEAVDVIRGL